VVTLVGAVRIDDADLILRLLAAVLLCSLIGFERSTRDEVAGLRTHALVGLGAALFTLVSAYGFADFATAASPQPDPTRIAAQIVSGIGFLGAGAIIRASPSAASRPPRRSGSSPPSAWPPAPGSSWAPSSPPRSCSSC
jgi:uncharacterized membrane protein YhiD involved in acid resistance